MNPEDEKPVQFDRYMKYITKDTYRGGSWEFYVRKACEMVNINTTPPNLEDTLEFRLKNFNELKQKYPEYFL